MKHFTELTAWSNGMDLVAEIYHMTKFFPKEELFGLTSQIRRSSMSILANIAEGFGRFTYPDKASKYTIARAEAMETEAHLHIAVRLQLVTPGKAVGILELVQKQQKLLAGLIAACKQRTP